MVILRSAFCYQLDAGADAVAVALGPAQREVKPVAGFVGAVHPNLGFLAEGSHHNVDAAISVKVGESPASVACGGRSGETGLLGERHPLSGRARIAKDRIRLIDRLAGLRKRFDMAAADEQIFPS